MGRGYSQARLGLKARRLARIRQRLPRRRATAPRGARWRPQGQQPSSRCGCAPRRWADPQACRSLAIRSRRNARAVRGLWLGADAARSDGRADRVRRSASRSKGNCRISNFFSPGGAIWRPVLAPWRNGRRRWRRSIPPTRIGRSSSRRLPRSAALVERSGHLVIRHADEDQHAENNRGDAERRLLAVPDLRLPHGEILAGYHQEAEEPQTEA